MKRKLILSVAAIATVLCSFNYASAKTEDGSGTPPVGEVGGGGDVSISCNPPLSNTCMRKTVLGVTVWKKSGVATIELP